MSPPEEEFSDKDLREMHALFQAAALEAFPNPERIGCPGTAVLDEMAALPMPSQHSAYEHVKTCSPCLREMLELRAAKLRARKMVVQRRVLWIGGVAAALFVAATLFPFLRTRGPSFDQLAENAIAHGSGNLPVKPDIGVVDSRAFDVERGQQGTVTTEPVLARSTKQLWILLASSGSEGQYAVELRNPVSNEVSARYGGSAAKPKREAVGFPVVLQAKADLSRLSSGRYILAWGRVGSAYRDFEGVRIQ